MNKGDIINIESNMGFVKEYRIVKVFDENAIKCELVKSGKEYRFHISNGRVEALQDNGQIRHFGHVA